MAKVYKNLGFECMHLIGQNKHSKFTCNTLRILPVTMTCAVLCWQTYLGMYSSAFCNCHIWALKKAFEKSNKCQREPKIWVLHHALLALIIDWLAQTDKIGCYIFPARMTCAERLFGNTFLNFVLNFSLKGGNWSNVYDNSIFLKWGILNVPFCSIFVPFHFDLIMTLVALCLDNNLYMILLISALGNFKVGVVKPIFWILVPLAREGVANSCLRGHGLLSLYSSYTKFK